MGSITDETTKIEEEEAPTFAPSIPVPNVQELFMKDPLQVPQRYVIRNQEEMPQNSVYISHFASGIPIIDLSLLSKGNKGELKKLDLACQKWGFFQLVNHGVANQVLQEMKDATSEFFRLPLEEKNKIAMPPDDIQGYGHAYVVEEEQTLDWSDALMLIVSPSRFRKLKLWPTAPKGFKETIEVYTTELEKVAVELLGCLSLVMGMEKGALLQLHKELVHGLRVNYYPPCALPDKVLGLSPHSDTSTITILMQQDDVCGLQIRHQGGWVPVEPIPNALVVNVGDVTEILSNGKYKSVEHRAVTNENYARLSYATFFIPRDEVEIGPLDQMIDSNESVPMYKKVIYGEYLRQSMKMKHEGKAHTQMAKTET